MRSFFKIAICCFVFFAVAPVHCQHYSKLTVETDTENKVLTVSQSLTYYNQSNDTIGTIVLNDWNNAYSDKNSLLGRRFSDEFVRSFHLAKEKERGSTSNISITDNLNTALAWSRPSADIVEIALPDKLPPSAKITLQLTYTVKIPSNQFTKFGYGPDGELILRNWFLAPARFENHDFIRYSNANLDDIANGISDYDIDIKIPVGFELSTDLNTIKKDKIGESVNYIISGKSRNDFSVFIEPKSQFRSYKNSSAEVITDLKDKKLGAIEKAIVVDRVVNFVSRNVGQYPYQKISISQVDYERNPFYGLNQLPSFLSPFPNEFLYELKFLKTYLSNYLKNSLHLDARKDYWIYDAIQVYMMMKYMDEQHPGIKMMGNLATWKILKSYNLINLDFNQQYSYYYMLMARKNLDQPLGDSKETLIRFNEKIASKYRAGLSIQYLDSYLGDSIVPKTISRFYAQNAAKPTSRGVFENDLKTNAGKNIDWFFNTVINSREIIDYKFGDAKTANDSLTFTITNRTGTTVPIPVYGIKNKNIVFKKWYENIRTDSSFTINRQDADKIVLNYQNEVPEFNRRNNYKKLGGFFPNNRPFKFAFMKDLEDPRYNQILYVPTLTYNFYDGLSPGLRFHNKTLLDKPFIFDVNPVYSPKTESLTGSFGFSVNQYNRESKFFNTRYGVSGSFYHYAPDAAYFKLNPSVNFLIREKDFRDNRKQGVTLRYNIVRKDRSLIVIDSTKDNYSIFSARYFNSNAELTNHLTYNTDFQLSKTFGKIGGEIQYRKLFDNNRQVNLRFYAGTFIYNRDVASGAYDFGLYKPNDYLFDYNFLGRSETTGILSQQLILAEGGFKSKVNPASANQWMATTNASFNIWNWIEIYGDVGLVKNHGFGEKFVYDSGVRLNFVPDYFELYFPVYSNNGWEIAQSHYSEKIRFIITLSPKTLLNLFTRKWL